MTTIEWIAIAALVAAAVALIHHFGLAALRKDIQAMFGAASGTPVVINLAAAPAAPAPAAQAALAAAPAPAPGPSVTDLLFKPAAPVAAAPAAPAEAAPGNGINEGTDLGWSNGNHFVIREGSKTFTVEPPAGWASSRTDPKGFYAISGTESAAAGKVPAYVRFTIGGVNSMDYMLGTEGRWTTADQTFPQQTGPFSVTMTLLDANHQQITDPGYGLLVQQNHP